ncbi:MAG: hypothetical protein JWM44_2851 [Bacilli bacterium]|nr:hypothetical protein [Bacilli bacterium]
MVNMQLDWTTVINDFGVLITFFGVFFGLKKKWPALFVFATYLEQHASQIVQEVETIGKEILSTPAGAIAAHSLHAEVDRVTEDFKKSEIGRLALVGLHNFGQAYTNLSDTQKVALTRFVVDSVPKEWNINDKTVIEVLAETEKAVDYFGSLEIVKAANIFTEAQKASAVTQVTTGNATV